jgi:hypothetical protein
MTLDSFRYHSFSARRAKRLCVPKCCSALPTVVFMLDGGWPLCARMRLEQMVVLVLRERKGSFAAGVAQVEVGQVAEQKFAETSVRR